MGEAKKRGTFEQRRTESVNKKAELKAQKEQEAVDWWASLSPEEQSAELEAREKRIQYKRKIGMIMGGNGFGYF